MLDIRLHTLRHVVTKFVLIEANRTFTGQTRRMVYADSKGRFTEFQDKIVYVSVETEVPNAAGFSDSERPWKQEAFTRQRGVELALSLISPKPGDLVMLTDLDEIVRPELLENLKTCTGYENPSDITRVSLTMNLFYYAYNCRHSIADFWKGVNAIVWPTSPLSPEQVGSIRSGAGAQAALTIRHAGWHCSSCFHTLAEFRNKFNSYSHTEYGSELRFHQRAHLVNAVRRCVDFFDRRDQTYVTVEPDAPPYMLAHADTLDWMLERRGPSAGFKDYYSK